MKRYESSIRVITAFFAVLLSMGIKKLLDNSSSSPDDFESVRISCSILSILLFLRILTGSANHMWFEYVKTDFETPPKALAKPRRLLKDFLFLILFGSFGIIICYSKSLAVFLDLNFRFLLLLLLWVIFERVDGLTKFFANLIRFEKSISIIKTLTYVIILVVFIIFIAFPSDLLVTLSNTVVGSIIFLIFYSLLAMIIFTDNDNKWIFKENKNNKWVFWKYENNNNQWFFWGYINYFQLLSLWITQKFIISVVPSIRIDVLSSTLDIRLIPLIVVYLVLLGHDVHKQLIVLHNN